MSECCFAVLLLLLASWCCARVLLTRPRIVVDPSRRSRHLLRTAFHHSSPTDTIRTLAEPCQLFDSFLELLDVVLLRLHIVRPAVIAQGSE